MKHHVLTKEKWDKIRDKLEHSVPKSARHHTGG